MGSLAFVVSCLVMVVSPAEGVSGGGLHTAGVLAVLRGGTRSLGAVGVLYSAHGLLGTCSVLVDSAYQGFNSLGGTESD